MDYKEQVESVIKSLKERLPLALTTVNLSKAPGNFIPALGYMCQETEEEAANAQEQKYKPKLFSFFSSPSLKWRYVSVNNKALASNSSVKMKDSNYSASLEMFYTVFDFNKFGYER
ncbi:MAG: hypothetical protein JSY10_27985 [Paenibacillus sp.]|nr:hypothetical protein [Paenibacillus sp.]